MVGSESWGPLEVFLWSWTKNLIFSNWSWKMGQIEVEMFFFCPLFHFFCLFIYLFGGAIWGQKEGGGFGATLGHGGVSSVEQWHTGRISASVFYLFSYSASSWSVYTPCLWRCVRHLCPIFPCHLLCIRAEPITVAIAGLCIFCPESGGSLPVDLTLSDLRSVLLPR